MASERKTALKEWALTGGGEMGDLMRSIDWSRNPLGPIENWPQSLRTTLSILLTSKHPIFLWWGKDLIQFYNEGYRPILGETKHPLAMGQRGRECWSEIWDVIAPMIEAVMERGESTFIEDGLLVLNRNGFLEECYFTYAYSPIRDESGGVGGVFVACTENTKRVLNDRRLRVLSELSARDGERHGLAEACEKAMGILASDPNDVPFALIYLFDSGNDSPRLQCAFGLEAPTLPSHWPLSELAATGKQILMDLAGLPGPIPAGPWEDPPRSALLLPITRPGSGAAIGALIVGLSPRLDPKGDYRRFLTLACGQIAATFADVAAYDEERKRAEALAALDKAKTDFFSNVSHELRTPLTLMLGPLEDSLRDAAHPLDDIQSERIRLIQRNGARLLSLVNNLLEFSRLESGRARAVFSPVDLDALTSDLAGLFRSAMEMTGLAFSIDCAPLPEQAYVDAEMWEKIIVNLLSNAYKFTPSGKISLSLRLNGDCFEAIVADTGIGISKEDLPRIFDRFHRVRNAGSIAQQGSGIGLAMVQDLAQIHGGSVTVESEIGKGSRFIVSIPRGRAHLAGEKILPADDAKTLHSQRWQTAPLFATAIAKEGFTGRAGSQAFADVAAALPPIGMGSGSGKPFRILLAEDNADMREYLVHLLKPHWSVETAGDGQAALTAIRANPPDLVLTDVMMPRLDGFGMLKEIRSHADTASLPVIMLSARAGEEATLEGIEAGADDYLVKPFSSRELLVRIAARLEISEVRARERRARQEAQDAEKQAHKFLALVEQSSDFVGLGSPNGRLTFINEAGKRMIGIAGLDPAMGTSLLGLIDPEDVPEAGRILTRVQQRGRWEGEIRLRHSGTGKTIPVWCNIFTFNEHDDPESTALAIVTRNLSQLRETEEHLRQAQKMEAIGKLAGGIAHDFNNLLTAINGYSDLALEMVPQGTLHDYLREIRNGGERAATLTRQLLAYSRKQVMQPKLVNLNDIVQEFQKILLRLIGEHIELKIELASDGTMVKADPGQVEQILLNLAVNARDAMPHGGILTLATSNLSVDAEYAAKHLDSPPGQYAVLTVSDNGVGMSKEVLARAFEPFFTTKEVGKGTGLGLSSVYGIAKQSGGSVMVVSEEGRGSSFRVFLPAFRMVPAETARVDPVLEKAAAGKGEVILLVEDESAVLEYVKRILEQEGYAVLAAASGDEALEIAERSLRPIDLLLTDIVMPGMNGRRLAQRFGEMNPDTRILYMSGYTEDHALTGAGAEMGEGFLQKPFTAEDLHARIRAKLGGTRGPSSNKDALHK
ncbi:MAG: response regulator [Fibrobacteria bacterium]